MLQIAQWWELLEVFVVTYLKLKAKRLHYHFYNINLLYMRDFDKACLEVGQFGEGFYKNYSKLKCFIHNANWNFYAHEN